MKTTEKHFFLVFSPNSSAGIIGITDNKEFAKSMQSVFVGYEEVKFLDSSQWRIDRVKEIAPHYHDRECGNWLSMCGQKCSCCGQKVDTTTGIEHDSRDFSKDLNVCMECYTEIINYWKVNSVGKIAMI